MDAYDDYHRQIAAEAHKPKDPDPAREMEAAFEVWWGEDEEECRTIKDWHRAAFAAGWKARGER